ncbi:hypothetical protein MTO96_010979 [Rhipicephalus appendiculatus]
MHKHGHIAVKLYECDACHQCFKILSKHEVPLESALGAHRAVHLPQLWPGFQPGVAPPELTRASSHSSAASATSTSQNSAVPRKHERMMPAGKYVHYCPPLRQGQ